MDERKHEEEHETTEATPAKEEDKEEDNKTGARNTLKIEVHATATHHGQGQHEAAQQAAAREHQRLEPVVAHAQSHDISHNMAVGQEFTYSPIRRSTIFTFFARFSGILGASR